MRLLLDTHSRLWWLREHPSLSSKARRAIAATENQISVSTASAWELSIKNNSGKLEIEELLQDFEVKLAEEGMLVLPISLDHALRRRPSQPPQGPVPPHARRPGSRRRFFSP